MESPKFSCNAGCEPNILAKHSNPATVIVANKASVFSLVSSFWPGKCQNWRIFISCKDVAFKLASQPKLIRRNRIIEQKVMGKIPRAVQLDSWFGIESNLWFFLQNLIFIDFLGKDSKYPSPLHLLGLCFFIFSSFGYLKLQLCPSLCL